ncbi:MAG TPA: adenylosuccinate synthase [Candidatus Limiplasma sp.]|nr:adenylosuccinate synthase [Candidatus Limiplasma sp.]HRX09278.1 adenylosuccinate synthase [Candidatus Limiplasma sp.]
MVRVIVGANWGDEGKGKITDVLAENSDVVVRFQGGANAGHTIINDYGKFALHLLPSGVFHQNITNLIAPGVALDIDKLFNEYESVVSRGVPAPKLYISDRAQVMMPYHVDFDKFEEERLGKNSFGSTKSGIAPFYGDKYLKIGLQVSQLFDKAILRERLESVVRQKNVLLEHLYHKPLLDVEQLMSLLQVQAEKIRPFVIDSAAFLHQALKDNKSILMEGQLGALRDPDHGIYPYVTSSSPLAGFSTVGGGVPANAIKDVLSVTKAYSSCVGAGPFTTELFGDEAEELRKRGGDAGEYGATTGRPRRVGWFDAVATRYGCMVHGATECVLTNLDVLAYLDEIQVCTAYECDGEIIDQFPSTPKLMRCKPVYTKLPGWKTDIRGLTEFDKLPEHCRQYVDFLEEQIGVPIRMVSTGPKRNEILYRKQ